MLLSDQDRRLYEEKGYLLSKALVSRRLIAQIRDELKDIHTRMSTEAPDSVSITWEDPTAPEGERRIQQLMSSEKVSKTIEELLHDDALLDLVSQLMSPDISLFHSKLLPKEAGVGMAIPWHQDYAYWKRAENRPLMINCQIAIDPMTLENGCLEFIPGSHRWGLQEHERHEEAFDVFLPGRYYVRDEAEAVPMDPGDGVFFSSLVIHGSAPNTSDRPRWANTFAFNVTGNGKGADKRVLRGAARG